jgi:hypothetical protein
MNTYQETNINFLREVPRTKEELDRAMNQICTGLKDNSGNTIQTECYHQSRCIQRICPIYIEYLKLRNIIDDIRKPTIIYVDKPDPRKFIPKPIKERDYKIKPKVKCRQMCKIQITKMSKKEEYKDILEILSQISEHVEGFRFKRAYNLCVKNNIDKLAETLSKFIENN